MKDRQIGDPVHLKNAPGIEAIITAIVQRTGGYVEYEITWIINGEIKVAWVTPLLIESEEKGGPLGFSGKPR